jgi:polyisoprenoid-binding protein YceI
MRRATVLCATILLAAPLATLSATAGDDPEDVREIVKSDSLIEFHASATFTKVVGVFRSWHAELKVPQGDLQQASLKTEIEAASVHTGSGLKDKEVRGKKFFAVDEFPTILFVSSGVHPAEVQGQYVMQGALTLRGITKPVEMILRQQSGKNGHDWLDGEMTFNRRDFGMVHNVPFNKVANTVRVELHLELANRRFARAESR